MGEITDKVAAGARRLIRSERTAAMATCGLPEKLAAEGSGDTLDWPYASLVEVACDIDGSPILLLSQLAVHTRNIARDPRVSLLFDGTRDRSSPLTGGRVTVSGRASLTNSARHHARFLSRHPEASEYAGFADFGYWHVVPTGAHLVAGFGKINSIAANDLLLERSTADRFSEIEDSIVAHMNTDHREAVQLFARNLLGREGENWEISGCDPEGVDLRCGLETARLDFGEPAFDTASVRETFVEMRRRARSYG